MDIEVKSLLDYVCNCNDVKECQKYLRKAFDIILQIDRLQFTTDLPQVISTNILVQCTDLSIKNDVHDIAEDCINLFFTRAVATDPNRCVAYIYMAQLSAPTNNFDTARLEKAGQYITKAINLATKNPVLYNEIYKSSVLYWQFCHPFLRPGFYHHVLSTFHNVVKALGELNDVNYNWRAILYITLIEIYFKTSKKSEAVEIAKVANVYIKKFAPSFFKRLFELMIRYQSVDSIINQTQIKSSVELFAFYNIMKLNYSIDVKDISKEITKIMILLKVMPNSVDNSGQFEDIVVNSPRDGKKKAVSKDPVVIKPRPVSSDSSEQQHLLLELTRLCLKNNLLPLAQICIGAAMPSLKHKKQFYTQFKFVESEIMVKLLGVNQESYSRKSVETRLKAIKLCEENISIAVKQHDAPSVQCGCVTLWNLSLPLLQSNLRYHLCKPLTLVAQALEDIQSVFVQLRCQVHRELALCEEKEHIKIAISHLKKAIALDGSRLYHNQLTLKLNRLTLLSEIYIKPDNPEDVAGKIIEKAREVKSLGTKEGMRALLVKAGITLSPDAFQTVLDSESSFFEKVKLSPNMTDQLAERVQSYNANISKIDGHLLRIGDKHDQIRVHLWADLSKVARKHGAWDVCRTAAMFCLLYDDNRWLATCKDTTLNTTEGSSLDSVLKSDENVEEISSSKKKKINSERLPLSEREHVRLLAEINFIQGEACLNLLYQENVKLNDLPVYPQDYSKHGKNYEAANPADDKDWEIYCQWIQQMNSKITSSFLRGLYLGYNLNESCIVGNAATYLWNYNLHIIEQNRQFEIVGCFAAVLEGIQKVDYSEFIILLVNICINLATGLMMPWMPAFPDRPTESQIRIASVEKSSAQKNQSKLLQVLIPPQALPDLKKAIEVCEYVMDIINKKKQITSIPLPIKAALLKTWVIAKQMSQQQISRSLIKDDDPERQTSQIIVDLEMHTHTKNGVMEFRDLLSLSNLVTVMLKYPWKDALFKLQLYTRLAEILYNNKHYELVVKVAKAVTKSYVTETSPNRAKAKTGNSLDNNHIEEKVSYLFLLMGQSLTENMEGQAVRWEAINNFIKAAEFSIPSHNYQILMKAARNYWNSIQPLINISSERKSLKASLQEILSYISQVTNKITELNSMEKIESCVPELNRITLYGYVGKNWESEPIVTNDDDDQKLQVSLYNVLCDCYEDSNNWEMVIKTLNTAISDLHQSCHKFQLFRRRIVVKAKLGESMLKDLQKFRDEKEDFVAILWHDIALHSNKLSEQCIAYQNAIESLSSVEYNWQKIDYLLEFSEWLYTYQMPEQIVVDQIEWAIDILMSMTSEINKKKSRNKKIDSKTSRSSILPSIDDTTLLDKENAQNLNSNENDSHTSPWFYIPQEKNIIIGALLQDCTAATERMINVKQLNYLIKCYVLLCEIYTPASPFYQSYSLMAYSFTIRLWQVCVASALACYLEISKSQPISIKDPVVLNKNTGISNSKGKDKKEKVENCTSPTKEKNKKKFLSVNISSLTSEEWAVFEIPSDLEEIFTHQSLESTGINESTITSPMLTLYYLDKLVSNLRNIGFHHLSLPVLALSHAIASFIAHSKSFVLYTHCKRMEVCAELNLPQCSSFHENIIDQMSGIDSNELIEIRKKFHEHIQEKNDNSEKPHVSWELKKEKPPHKCHLGHYFQDTFVYQIWTKTAEALIEQTHYQLARKYLCEAYKFATSFKDVFYQGKLCFLKAKLAFVEAQYKDAFDLCMKAQEIMVGDMECWYEIAMLKADSALHTFPKNGYQFVEQFLQSIIKEFEKLSLIRPNQAVGYGFTIALIQAKIGEVQVEYFIGQYNNLSSAYIQEVFKSALKSFDISTEFLLKHKFKKDAVKVMHKHAKLLHQIALASTNDTNTLQLYYLNSITVFNCAIMYARVIFYDVMMLLPKDLNLSLPIHREFADLQKSCAEVMVEIQTIQTNNEIEKIQRNQHDIERIKLEEKFINKSPDYLDIEKEWIVSKQWIANEILSLATSAHSLARTIQWIKSRSLLIIGKCLLNLSFLKQTNLSQLWLQFDVDTEKETLDNENIESDENKEGKGASVNNLNQIPNLSRKIKEMKWKEDISLCYFCQATECLTQALNTAFQLKQTDIIRQASYELMNSIGQYDINASSLFLALYQSCQASGYLTKLLEISQPDPYSCRLSALLHQRKHMLNNYTEKNFICTDMFSSVTNSLETEWQAWKNTLILTNHFDLIREFPNNFNFVILQHSPDKHFLFCSLLDKYRPIKSAAIPKQQMIVNTLLTSLKRSSLSKCRVNPDKLHQLLKMFKLYKEDIRRTFLKQKFQRKNHSEYKNILETLQCEVNGSNIPESITVESEDWMQTKFEEIVALMEDYFAPLLKPLQTAFQTSFSASVSNTYIKDNFENCYVIILADPDLLELPLESVCVFRQFENIISVSRDISLQMFYHRFHQEEVSDETKDKKKKDKKQLQIPSRIPVKDTGKKRKREPIEHITPPWGLSIDTDSFKYIVDPNYEFSESEEYDFCKVFKSLLVEYEQQYTANWTGLSGDIRNASSGEWEIYLNGCGSFIFFAPYKLTSYLSPSKIPAFNISKCMLVYQFDLSENYLSCRHQFYQDALKLEQISSLETPVSTALLLSLAGVRSIMSNQWSRLLIDNINLLRTSMKYLLSHGFSTGEALRHIQAPYLKIEIKSSTEENANKQERKIGRRPTNSDKKKDLSVANSSVSISAMKSFTGIDVKELQPNWFNMVCYGLPNLFVTQP